MGTTGITVAAQPTADSSATARAVRVQISDQPATRGTAPAGFALQLTRADGSPVPAPVALRLPARLLTGLYGADYAARVRWTEHPAGGPDTHAQPVTSSRDALTNSIVVTPTVSARPMVLEAAGSPTAANGTGTFAATSLSPSAAWQVSAQTGDFSWSYPLRVPPAPAGPAPQLALSYDSGSVDGETGSTNNQPTAIGEGWSLAGAGFIERSYVPCAEDGVPTSGDECWKTDNATLSFAGHSGPLVKDAASGVWRLQNDDGTRVEKLTGAGNGDNDGEYWRLTTPDGTQYFFGRTSNSAWTLPVFGNDSGEPCHGATFAASACTQAWRWNLDYVVDPRGNAESFSYAPQTNLYRENNTTAVGYTRGGQLTEIDYGYRAGASGPAPERVLFDLANRCSTTTSCDSAHPANWPDVPWDQNCAASPCTGLMSPTFWSTQMVTRIHTQLLTGTTYSDVDAWSLAHSFPAPGDGTSPALWLATITHTGYSGTTSISLPAVVMHGSTMQNRVWAVDGLAPLDKYRISSIDTEAGGTISVAYSPQQCTPSTEPAAQSNTMRCFPQWWTPQTTPPQPPQLDWFHKYVVTEVTADPRTGGTGDTALDETFYDYTGTPAWRYDTSPLVPDDKRTWSVYAGYSTVRIRHGDQNNPGQQQTTSYLFFQGLDGDRAGPAGGTKTATVTASDGSVVPDSLWLAGRVREQTSYNGYGGPRVANTITTAWASPITANDGTNAARMIRDADVLTRTALSAGGDRVTETKTSYDSYGRPIAVDDLGDTATPDDDLCTRTSYADNTAAWLMSYPAEVSVVGRTCAQDPALPADAISDTRTYYDGSTTLASPPSTGEATRVDVAVSYTGSTPNWQTTALTGYDPLGRPTTVTDPRLAPGITAARTTTTSYTPATGPVTQTVVTNPLNWTATTIENPAWGLPTAVIDPNGHRTDASYDALGRRTQVWLPDRAKTAYPTSPSIGYAYTVSATAPDSVATTTLTPAGGTITAYTLYDGLLRARQTQAPSEGGGRMLTDTFYDNAGRVSATNNTYYATGNPSATLLIPTLAVPSSTQTLYDGAGRKTADLAITGGNTELWRTSYAYGGDHTDTTPPAGGTPTTTYTDARGHTTRLRQYHAATPTGSYDDTTYTYDHRGDRTAMTDPAGNQWTWTFDTLGRQTSAHDPDTGTSTTSYDPAGRVAATTDARGDTLAYSYDALDRKTGEYQGTTAGAQLAGWTYDTLAKGQPTASVRYDATGTYTEAVTGYDAADRPTGRTTTIPASAGALAGSYTTSLYYNLDGSLSAQVDPAEGGLPAETLRYDYDSLGNPTGLYSAAGSYLAGTTYTHLGQLAQAMQAQSGATVYHTDTFDAGTGRLTEQLTQRVGANAVVSDHTYTYTNAGTVTSDTDTNPNTGNDTQCYRYDYLQRLTTAWTPATGTCTADPTSASLGGPAPYWTSYTYDLTGNRTTSTEHATTPTAADTTDSYAYPPAGTPQPHAVQAITHTTGTTTGTDNYHYDPAGHTDNRAGHTLTWDTEGHLTALDPPAGTQTRTYTADGTLLLLTDPTAGTTLYLGDTELHLTPGATTPSAVRTYTALGRPLAERSTVVGVAGSHCVFLDTNPTNTATATIDTTTGTVTHRYLDPFGNPRGPTTTWPDQHGYLNAPSDPASGLTHLGARDYDPTTGRFLTTDPLLNPTDPQSLTGYAYADNNPTTKSDPSGLKVADCAPGDDCSASSLTENTYYNNSPDPGNNGGDCNGPGGQRSCGGGPPSAPGGGNASPSAIDPSFGSGKYGGVASSVVTSSFVPGSATGILRVSIFIPTASITGYAGDDRGFDPGFDPSNSRLTIYIDLDTGLVVARQNPSCYSGHLQCAVLTPALSVSENLGLLTIGYEGSDAKQPLAKHAGFTVRGNINVTLNPAFGGGSGYLVAGSRTDYPSLEIYHYNSSGAYDGRPVVQQRAGGVTPSVHVPLFPSSAYLPGVSIKIPHIPIGLAPGAMSNYSGWF